MSMLSFLKAKIPTEQELVGYNGAIRPPAEMPYYLKKIFKEAQENKSKTLVTDVATLEKEIVWLREKTNNLFGCETEARKKIEAAIDSKNIYLEKARLVHNEEWNYMPLSLDMFTWRDYRGLPVLAIFGVDNPTFCLRHRAYAKQTEVMHQKLPSPIIEKFGDVWKVLETYGKRHRPSGSSYDECTITAQFNGVIPDDARNAINKAKSEFGRENIYLISEPKFEFNVKSHIDPDPIVVGWKGNTLWYITDFDLTPVEEAALIHKP
jgi:hypothetical protein